jgi:hypothetical protein
MCARAWSYVPCTGLGSACSVPQTWEAYWRPVILRVCGDVLCRLLLWSAVVGGRGL